MKNGRAFAPLFLLLLTTFAVLLTALLQANIPQKASDPLSLQRPLNRWRLPGDAMVQADLSHERSTLHLNTHAPNRQGRYMRLTNHALAFVPGQRYTLTFRGRSELPRRVIIGVQWTLDGTPRRQESENVVVLGGEWRTYRHTFIAQRSWGNAYFELGRTYGTIDLDSVMIEAGAPDAIALVRTALHDNPLLLSLLLTLPIASALLYRRSLAERRILLPSLAMLCFLVDYLLWRISITRWSTPWLGLPILLADILSNVPLIALILLFWPRKEPHRHTNTPTIDPHTLPVCLFVPTVNEGVEVLEATLKGALVAQAHYQNTYPESSVRIVLCNDGKVAGYAYWETVEQLAKRLGVDCVTRTVPGGAKAGNIENARTELGISGESLMVVFDADQIASPEFLLKVIPPFADPRVAWVQTPQRYSNLENPVARWANEQQAFFYDVICPERARVNAVPICGTNVAIRVSALESIGGFPHFSVTEDAAASLLLHPDWQGVYLAEYLAEGLGPMDIEGFFKQQRRWAVGMLELLFFHMHPTRSRLHPLQWVQYALSGVHYLRGLRDALLFFGPVVFLLTNYSAVTSVDIVSLGKHIFPLVLVSYLLVWFWLGGTMTWRTVLLGFGSFPIYTEALWKVLRRQRVGFEVTPKQKRAPSKNILLTHYLALLAGLAALLLGAMRPLTLPIIVTQLCILYGMMGLSSIVYLHIKTTTQQAPAPKESRDKETAACAL